MDGPVPAQADTRCILIFLPTLPQYGKAVGQIRIKTRILLKNIQKVCDFWEFFIKTPTFTKYIIT